MTVPPSNPDPTARVAGLLTGPVITRRALGAGVAAAVAALGLAACGDGGGSTSSNGGGTTDTLIVETAFNLKTLDPARMFETTGLMIERTLYSTLLTYKGGDVKKPVPDLASSYEVSDDATTYTFTLNDKAVFASGSKVTADDVAFSLNRVKAIAGNPSFLMTGITAKADGDKVVLTSETPNTAIPAIVSNPALGVVEKKVVEAAGGTDAADASTADKAEASLNKTSAGSGPYTLTAYSTTTQVELTANPKYWGTAPTYKKIIVRNVQANVQKLDVLKGTSQIAVDLSPQQAEGMSNVQVINGASPNVFFVFTNNNPAVSEVTSNPDFQEAVRYGIDYDGLVKLAGKGALQAAGVIPSLFLGSLPEGSGVKRDVAKAKAALAKSGLSNPKVSIGYPSDIQSNGLSFGDLAARVQQNLAEVGITVELKGQSVQVALEAYRAGKEEMGLWYWGPDYPDPSDYLVFLPGNTVGLRAGWKKGSDADLESLGEKAATTTDDNTRTGLYQDIQKSLNTSSPFMPLIQPAQILVAGEAVKNIESNALWLVNLSELG